MVKRQKTKTMAVRHQKTRREISLFNEEKENYENNIEDKMDLD